MNNKIKVLCLTTSYPVEKDSVSGVFVHRLVCELNKICQVKVLAPADSGVNCCSNNNLICFNYAPRSLQLLAHKPGGIPAAIKSKKWTALLLPLFVVSYLVLAVRESKKVDLIFANWSLSGCIGAACKLLLRKPLVTCLRGDDVGRKVGLVKRAFLYIAVKYSDRIVVVSEEMFEILKELHPNHERKIHFIKNGVDKDVFLSAYQKERIKRDKVRLVFVGSLIARKNIRYMVESISRLVSKGYAFHLDIVGDGPEKNALMDLVHDLKIDHLVSFLGQKKHSEVPEILWAAQYFISPSLHEGRPNSVIEGICAGCIPILSDISGHREIAQHFSGRILFDPERPDSLAELLACIHDDRAYFTALESSREKYVEKNTYSWGECSEKYTNIFNSIVCCAEVD